ncbi:MAG TPA: shikimate kinase [Propionicimonas sp.]|nr:shikimate kinase [Propionicimonas sp.]HRA05597.1 shikimate kinase [Propionicimonas sp.]
MSPELTLIGIPGAGKTTVGELLARELGVGFVDVAELVEAEVGGSAPEFFATAGEAAYREAEVRVALAALRSPGVVALSSGATDSADVRAALSGPVVWLRTSVATATRRLSMNSLGMGALVAIRNRMDAMLAQRARWYSTAATAVVDTDRLTPAEVAAAILENHGGR